MTRRFRHLSVGHQAAAIIATTLVGVGAVVLAAPGLHRPATCHLRANGQLPDPACTPGVNDRQASSKTLATTVCKAGYSATIRHTSQATKDQVLREYGLTPSTFTGEIDHLIPLSLGGADVLANLWPEAGKIPNHKDLMVEGPLRAAVCDGLVPLDVAQARLVADWRTAMNGIPK